MTHIVYPLESKTFLTKLQQEKAGFYKSENEKENHNNSWHSRFNSHFRVFSYLLSPPLINTTTQTHLFALIFKTLLLSNTRKFLCNLRGYQNIIAFDPISKPSSLYRLSRKHKTTCSSDISYICPGSGQAQDWWTSWPSLAQRAYFITHNQDAQRTALNSQSSFQNGKGWDLSWTAHAQKLCYWSEKSHYAMCELWGCAQSLRDESGLPTAGKQEVRHWLTSHVRLSPFHLLRGADCPYCMWHHDFSTD